MPDGRGGGAVTARPGPTRTSSTRTTPTPTAPPRAGPPAGAAGGAGAVLGDATRVTAAGYRSVAAGKPRPGRPVPASVAFPDTTGPARRRDGCAPAGARISGEPATGPGTCPPARASAPPASRPPRAT